MSKLRSLLILKCFFIISHYLEITKAFKNNLIYLNEGLASCTWNVEQNKNTRGGVSQNFNTLSECRTGCIAAKKTTCKNGLDWQAQGTPNFKCFFTTNPQLYDSPGVDHHTLTCSGAEQAIINLIIRYQFQQF